MQTVHELMTLLSLHWANNFALGLGICCHTTDGIGIKKRQLLVLCGSARSYICAC